MRASGSKSSGFGLACFFVCCDKAGGKSVSLDFVEWGKRRQLRDGGRARAGPQQCLQLKCEPS